MSLLRRIGALAWLGLLSMPLMAGTATLNVTTATGSLSGSLQTPEAAHGKPPLVLIIPGSGPTDRDGNSPLGITAAPYRWLAEGLAAQGIASVRIDKRGMFGSAHPGLDANKVSLDDYAHDVDAWVKQLRKSQGASCLWLLGHSEGALVAARAASDGQGICGLVLVAGAGRPLADVLLEQLQRNPANAPILEQASAAVASLRQGKPVDVSSFPAALQQLFNPAVQGFEMSVFPVDPVRLLQSSQVPVLVVQGTDDLQVTVDDAKRLAAARSGTTLQLIDGMNHVLKTPAAGKPANLASYRDPSLPLADALVPAIAGFIKAH